MFLNWAEEGTPLVPFEALFGNPGYIAGILILLAVVWLIMYTPWALADRKGTVKN